MTSSKTIITNHTLKPTWSRLLHRMHTLGTIQHRYHNSLASISSLGEYPRSLTTPKEENSIAINGNHEWLFENWKQVSVRVAAKYHQADFLFTSEDGELFHEISLTSQSQWSCFECMLKLFEDEMSRSEEVSTTKSSPVAPLTAYNKINSHITQVAKSVNREISRGKKVICSMPLAGKSMLKDLEFKSLMTQFGTAALKRYHSKLTLNPLSVSCHEIIKKHNSMLSTLLDSKGNPLLQIRSV